MARKRASSAPGRTHFTKLSARQQSDFKEAKAEMSRKYLPRPARMNMRVMAFRAMAPTAKSSIESNIVGVGIDEKHVDGIPTGIHSVTFLVKSKQPKSSLSRREMLPARVSGIPTDVEEVGAILPLAKKKAAARGAAAATVLATAMPNPKVRIRPAQPGSSIGFRDPNDQFVMAGTFGALVKDSSGTLYVLSNNHVLANESGIDANGQKIVGLPPGSPIHQPGLLDGGNVATDQIAQLTRWIDLDASNPNNAVDGAIAQVLDNSMVSDAILFIGPPQGVSDAAVDMIVHKFGRTTSYRAGRVSSVQYDVRLTYNVGDVIFPDQIAIRGLNAQPFSAAGDSGSAILERSSNKIVGLLFAGATNNSVTFANHIGDVLSALKVTLA
jgi:hypothetical protein